MRPDPADWEAASSGRRLAVAAFSGVWALILRLWCGSWRLDDREVPRLDTALSEGRSLVAVFWHGNYLPLFAVLAGRSALVVTSRSFRGAVIAGISRRFGYRTVQVGSRAHAAAEAMRRELRRPGGRVAVAVDGPVGPRFVAKPGAVGIAIRTGARIVPVQALAKGRIVLSRRWDKMEMPLPFARVTLRVGLPLESDEFDMSDIERAARRVEEAIHELDTPAVTGAG